MPFTLFPVFPRSIPRHGAALAAAVALGLAAPPAAAQPFIAVTEGSGPTERVRYFDMNPNAGDVILSDDRVEALARAIEAGHARDESTEIMTAGLGAIGDQAGKLAFLGTLAEQALFIGGLGRVNSGLTYLGLAVAGLQVADDLAKGNDTAAAVGAYKAVLGFAISKYGWGALQVAGASLYLFDLTLREWNTAVNAAGDDVWRDAFDEYYRDKGRSLNDWKRIVWDLYLLAAENNRDNKDAATNAFADYVEAEINSFVNTALTDDVSLFRDGGAGGLLSSFGYGNRAIAERMVADTKETIEAMIARDVMPEIAERAHQREMLETLDQMNDELRPAMNSLIQLEVTFWGTEGAAAVSIPFEGGDWGGPLGPDGTYTLDFTRYAWLRAGLPDRVVVETATGTMEAPIRVQDDHAVAVFGLPPATSMLRYSLTEGPRRCDEFLLDPASRRVLDILDTYDLPALPPSTLDFATLPSQQMIAGRFDTGALQWQDASPGSYDAENGVLRFGPPHVGHLAEIRDCDMQMITAGGQTQMTGCTFVRRADMPGGAVLRERRCRSSGQLELAGYWDDLGDGYVLIDMQSDEMREAMREVRRAMEEMGIDPLTGMITGAPGGLMDYSQIPGYENLVGGN